MIVKDRFLNFDNAMIFSFARDRGHVWTGKVIDSLVFWRMKMSLERMENEKSISCTIF